MFLKLNSSEPKILLRNLENESKNENKTKKFGGFRHGFYMGFNDFQGTWFIGALLKSCFVCTVTFG